MPKNFSALIDDWIKQTEQRIDAVYARSVELLGEEMTRTVNEGGRVPFKDGNLYRSLLASTSAMPKTSEGPFSGDNVGLVAATLKANQSVWLGYQAGYARRLEFGFVGADSLGRVYNQEGRHFVTGAIAEWPNIVDKAIKEIKTGSS